MSSEFPVGLIELYAPQPKALTPPVVTPKQKGDIWNVLGGREVMNLALHLIEDIQHMRFESGQAQLTRLRGSVQVCSVYRRYDHRIRPVGSTSKANGRIRAAKTEGLLAVIEPFAAGQAAVGTENHLLGSLVERTNPGDRYCQLSIPQRVKGAATTADLLIVGARSVASLQGALRHPSRRI